MHINLHARTDTNGESLTLAQLLLIFLLTGSLITNGLFYRHFRQASLQGHTVKLAGDSLLGTTVPSFEAKWLTSQPPKVDWKEGSSTILYYFSPTCIWCQRNAGALDSLLAQTKGYRFIALTSTSGGVQEFATRFGLPLDHVAYGAPTVFTTRLGLQPTPDTFVIDNQGIVRAHWTGAYAGDTRQKIIAFFNLSTDSIKPVAN